MRTNEERIRLIHERTAEIRKEQKNRRRQLRTAVCMAACLLLVVGIGILMPGFIHGAAAGTVSHTAGTASLVASHAALGYILMGLLSFLLGVSVTILLYRLRRHNDRKKQKDREDEL